MTIEEQVRHDDIMMLWGECVEFIKHFSNTFSNHVNDPPDFETIESMLDSAFYLAMTYDTDDET